MSVRGDLNGILQAGKAIYAGCTKLKAEAFPYEMSVAQRHGMSRSSHQLEATGIAARFGYFNANGKNETPEIQKNQIAKAFKPTLDGQVPNT